MTFDEYVLLVNPSMKYHENHWDYDVKSLNEMANFGDIMIRILYYLIKIFLIRGIIMMKLLKNII